MKNTFFICIGLLTQQLFAQLDTVQLEGAILLDRNRLDKIETQSVLEFNDSILQKGQPSLTNLLNFNSTIYFKESGAGMVSSPSFRGTTASQTAVLWNGININSQTTGQTDFNTVNVRGFDKILVKAGGGNVFSSNSSVGGSVELVNEIQYNQKLSNELYLKYGSFNSLTTDYDLKYATQNVSLNLKFSRNSSDNDYPFLDNPNQKNTNGEFTNYNTSFAVGYKINAQHSLRFLGNIFQADRNLAVISQYATRSKYEDFNTRFLMDWQMQSGKFQSNTKAAYLTETYKFYPNIKNDYSELGKVKTMILQNQLAYHFHSKLKLKTQVEFNHNQGFNEQNIGNQSRNLGSISLNLQHQIFSKFFYEFSVRQEFSGDYGNPTLYSLGINWNVNSFYNLKFNASKNFRIPTYNDLYWPGVGNTDLKPETSYQVEIGNEFHTKNLKFSANVYYNSVEDLIRWIPNVNPLGGILWQPQNVNDVEIYGAEAIFSAQKNIEKHHFSLTGTYAYTVSENVETKKQLIYVPFHKATAALSYSWNGISFFTQFLYNGKVYTTTQNEEKLPEYYLVNLGLDYDFGKENMYKIGFEVLNLMDYNYQNVESRPMPGRNFHVFLNIKF